jgi:hypothetical protein
MPKQLTLTLLHEHTNDSATCSFSKKQLQEIQFALVEALIAFSKTSERDNQSKEENPDDEIIKNTEEEEDNSN